MLEKQGFSSTSLYNYQLNTQYRWILNQYASTHTMIPSFGDLVEDNSLYFWDLSTLVINFSNRLLYGVRIMP